VLIKEEVRIVGFDDAPFEKGRKKKVPVVGAIYRGGKIFDGVLFVKVDVDGNDATSKLIKAVNSSRHKPQLKVIMLDGITVGGFNVIDLKELHEKTDLPVIAINRKLPDIKSVKNALKNFRDFKKRWEKIKNAGKIKKFKFKDKFIYYQCKGIERDEAEEIIRISCTRGYIPEPLRVAHLIAAALVKGESHGKA
jgi:hypothetical protein